MSLPWLPSPASGMKTGLMELESAVKACNSPPNICLHSPFLSFHPCGSLWITYFLSISEMNADLEFPYSAYPSKSSIFFKIFSLKWLFFLLWIREQLLTMEVICQWHLGFLFCCTVLSLVMICCQSGLCLLQFSCKLPESRACLLSSSAEAQTVPVRFWCILQPCTVTGCSEYVKLQSHTPYSIQHVFCCCFVCLQSS